MDNGDSRSDPYGDRAQLFDALSNLSSADFERLLVGMNMPRMNRAGAAAKIGEQVSALLEWADSKIGPGLDAIARHLAELNRFEFDAYLRSLVTTYEKWWEHYTITDAVGKVEQAQPEQPSVFDFGLMVQTVTKEREPTDPENNPRQQDKEKTERLPVLEGIPKYADDHVLLVGRPGSGKSTALIRLLLEEAALSPGPSPKLGRGAGGERIPVLVELRYWQTSVVERIRAFLYQHDPHLNLDDAALHTLLRQGRFLLLLDGLNELPSDEARTQLTTFRRDHPKVPMIFTTRDLGLGGDLGIEKKLEMQPLTEAQMKDFIRAYVPDQAEAMLRQLSDRLREFGQTPLLLWMLCEVFQQSPNRQMPTNLAEVFRAFTTMYEDSSVRKHEVALLKGDVRPLSDRRLWKEALKALAALMMQGETPVDFRVAIHRTEAERELGKIFAKEKFPVRDILDDLLKYHLLQNRTTDQLEFRHQLIQEYYAAEYLLDLLLDITEEELKRDYLNQVKWTEPIVLMLSLANEKAQALKVVKLAIDDVDWVLGAKLAGSVKEIFQQQTIALIDELNVSTSIRIELLEKAHSVFTPLALITHIGNQDPLIQAQVINALRSFDSQILVQSDTYKALIKKSMSADPITCENASLLLREIDKNKSNSPEDSYSSTSDENSLSDVVSGILKKLDSENKKTRWNAAISLGEMNDNRSFHQLIDALKNGDKLFRYRAALTLANIGKPEAGEDLINALSDEDLFVRRGVAYALGVIKDKAALSPLLSVISSQRNFVCEAAVFALGEIGGEDLTEPLSKVLDDSYPFLRGYVAEALGKIGSYNSLPILLDLINDPSDFVREMTVQAIGNFKDSKTIPILLNALLDENQFIRRKALESLEGIASDGNFLSSDIMQDEDSVVRKNAISLFESIGDDIAISKIFIALQDKNVDVRAWAIRALKKVGTPILISPLRSIASGGGEDMLNLISAIQSRCKFYNYDIWQTLLAAQQNDSTPSQSDKKIASTITIQTVERLTIMSDKAPIFNQQHATIGVNYAAEGSQQDFTQHIHAPEQNFEILLTGYKHFIDKLQQQNPHVTDETAIIQTIDTEARRIDTRWQNFLNLKRLWNGGKKAAIKVGEHFAESNPWGKGAIAFLEGVSEDVK